MSVTGVIGENSPLSIYERKKVKQESRKSEPTKDSVELSDEARSRCAADRTEWVAKIREKIADGFYFQPEVTSEVADKIVGDLVAKS
jgi:anti-sigma28 factor (negative regulator of flagellin synthesis)